MASKLQEGEGVSTIHLEKFSDTGELFARIDGKIIARKSIYDARVYPDSRLDSEIITYKSRIQHCGSCLDEEYDGYTSMDECCCIHAGFHSKKEENDYVKSIGFWNL